LRLSNLQALNGKSTEMKDILHSVTENLDKDMNGAVYYSITEPNGNGEALVASVWKNEASYNEYMSGVREKLLRQFGETVEKQQSVSEQANVSFADVDITNFIAAKSLSLH